MKVEVRPTRTWSDRPGFRAVHRRQQRPGGADARLRGRAPLHWRDVRVVIAQFDGSTTMRAPPLAAGLLAATLRREPELGALSIRVLAARRPPLRGDLCVPEGRARPEHRGYDQDWVRPPPPAGIKKHCV